MGFDGPSVWEIMETPNSESKALNHIVVHLGTIREI
jgi:hypothetical protein